MSHKKWLGFGLVVLVVAAFAVSFFIGLRQDAPVAAALRSRDVPGVFSGRRVEVYNSSGVPGRAREATQLLRDAGFDVVMIGNARSPSDSSQVLDRVGRLDLAEAVGRTLGIGRVVSVRDSARLVEVSVYLQRDWAPPVRR